MNTLFSEQLRELLLNSGKTQKELAEFIGVKQNTVSDWINRGTSPKVEHLYRIVDFFSISFDLLFTGCINSTTNVAEKYTNKSLAIDEQNLINTYREIDNNGKINIQNVIKEIWADHRITKSEHAASSTPNLAKKETKTFGVAARGNSNAKLELTDDQIKELEKLIKNHKNSDNEGLY